MHYTPAAVPLTVIRIIVPALIGICWSVLAAVVFVIPAHWPVLAIWLALLLLAVVSGSMFPNLEFFGRSLSRRPDARGAVALTFDDGPEPEHTLAVADALEAAGGRGTFFVVGRRAQEHPDVVRALVERGHQVGLHGHSHAWTLMLREPLLIEDLLAADAAVHAATGRHARWYRPPIGLTAPPMMNVLRQWRLFFGGWSVRPFDGRVDDPSVVRRRVAAAVRAGDVVLLHDASAPAGPYRRPPALDALPGILDDLLERGLKPVTMSELFDEPAWFEEDDVFEARRRTFRRGRLQLTVWATVFALGLSLLFFAFAGAAQAGEPDLPPELLKAAAALAVNDTVKASFEQRKSSVLFVEDMVRTGTLEMRRSDGRLVWNYADGPAFLMADGRFYPAGETAEEAGEEGAGGFSMPGSAGFTGILQALFTLEPKAVSAHFAATVLGPGRFELVPRQAQAKGLFSKVILEVGGEPVAVLSTTMEEPTGDTTIITFSATETGVTIPAERFQTPAERSAGGQ